MRATYRICRKRAPGKILLGGKQFPSHSIHAGRYICAALGRHWGARIAVMERYQGTSGLNGTCAPAKAGEVL
jgi:hypothetical protein